MKKHIISCLESITNDIYKINCPVELLNIICEHINFNDIIMVSAGSDHSVSLKYDGTLHSWGCDKHGQVSRTPTESAFVSVSADRQYSVALKYDGTLILWGKYGDKLIFKVLKRLLSSIRSCFSTVKDDNCNTVKSHVTKNQRHDETRIPWIKDEENQTLRTPKGFKFVSVSAGEHHIIALMHLKDDRHSQRAIISWDTDMYSQPPRILEGPRLVSISRRGNYIIGLRDNGRIMIKRQRSDGTIFSHRSDRSNLILKESGFVSISLGILHTVALKNDGTLRSWGCDVCNQVSDTPKEADFISVSAGDLHTVALKVDGTLVSWGWDAEIIRYRVSPHYLCSCK